MKKRIVDRIKHSVGNKLSRHDIETIVNEVEAELDRREMEELRRTARAGTD